MRKPKKSSPTRRHPQPKRKEVMPNNPNTKPERETRPRPSALAAGAAHLDGIDREIARIVANLRAPDSRSLLPQNEFV